MKVQKATLLAAISALIWMFVATPVFADAAQVCVQECIDQGMACQEACSDEQCVEACQASGSQCTENC